MSEATATDARGWCPECGCTATLFTDGLVCCDDQECAYTHRLGDCGEYCSVCVCDCGTECVTYCAECGCHTGEAP